MERTCYDCTFCITADPEECGILYCGLNKKLIDDGFFEEGNCDICPEFHSYRRETV